MHGFFFFGAHLRKAPPVYGQAMQLAQSCGVVCATCRDCSSCHTERLLCSNYLMAQSSRKQKQIKYLGVCSHLHICSSTMLHSLKLICCWAGYLSLVLACLRPAIAHTCVHDDVLVEHDDNFWNRRLVGIKNVSAPLEEERLVTRRELHQFITPPETFGTEAKRRQLQTKAQYLARPWHPIRINIQFVNVGSDPAMDSARTNFLTNVVVPQAVARLESVLEVSLQIGFARIVLSRRGPQICVFYFVEMWSDHSLTFDMQVRQVPGVFFAERGCRSQWTNGNCYITDPDNYVSFE